MLEPHLPEIDINNLQLEVSRKQTLSLSTHLAVFELLADWLQVGDKYHTAKLSFDKNSCNPFIKEALQTIFNYGFNCDNLNTTSN